MKILSISPYLPSECVGHAGAQLTYRNLKSLSRSHQVKLLCFINRDEQSKTASLSESRIEFESILFNRNTNGTLSSKLLNNLIPLLLAIIKMEPLLATKYDKSGMNALVKKVAAEFKPDVVHIEYNVMHHYARHFPSTPKILTQHDVTTKAKEREYKTSRSLIPKALNWLAYRQWNRYEPKLMKKFDSVITITTEDKDYANRWKMLPPIEVIPPQISVESIRDTQKIPCSLCFVGSFNRKPNNQALKIILKDIFPNVKKQIPEVRLRIAGKYLSNRVVKEIQKLEGCEYFGFVENIDEFIASSSLFLAPIISGAGLKMKITHSLACGTPVLTTSVGAEGIPLNEKEGLWVVDDIKQMIDKCISLISDTEYLIKVGKAGQRKVTEMFSSEKIEAKLEELYSSLIKKIAEEKIYQEGLSRCQGLSHMPLVA